jgi:L-2-hydroxyglutarate oxidase LhgO
VAGNRQLYEYCATHGVPCSRLGKLLVAPGRHQADALGALAAKAVANGVDDLQPLTPGQVAKLEPHVRAQGGGFLSPSSGVLDVQRLMASFAADAVATGRATLLKDARVVAGELHHASWRLNCEDGNQVACDAVVNCGGLQAQEVSSLLGVPREDIPRLFYARGCYFTWDTAAAAGMPIPFSRLVYPLPPSHGAGLGVHATLDVARTSLRFGPDVAFIDKLTYDGVDIDALLPAFTAAIRDYFPALPSGALKYAYAGVRPKLAGPGQPPADFRLMNHAGVPGLLALYGIESPGLTACMALADAVVARLQTS